MVVVAGCVYRINLKERCCAT